MEVRHGRPAHGWRNIVFRGEDLDPCVVVVAEFENVAGDGVRYSQRDEIHTSRVRLDSH